MLHLILSYWLQLSKATEGCELVRIAIEDIPLVAMHPSFERTLLDLDGHSQRYLPHGTLLLSGTQRIETYISWGLTPWTIRLGREGEVLRSREEIVTFKDAPTKEESETLIAGIRKGFPLSRFDRQPFC